MASRQAKSRFLSLCYNAMHLLIECMRLKYHGFSDVCAPALGSGRNVAFRWQGNLRRSIRLTTQECRDFQLVIVKGAARGGGATMLVELALCRTISLWCLGRLRALGEFRMSGRHSRCMRALCMGVCRCRRSMNRRCILCLRHLGLRHLGPRHPGGSLLRKHAAWPGAAPAGSRADVLRKAHAVLQHGPHGDRIRRWRDACSRLGRRESFS